MIIRGNPFFYTLSWYQRRAGIFDCSTPWRSFHCFLELTMVMYHLDVYLIDYDNVSPEREKGCVRSEHGRKRDVFFQNMEGKKDVFFQNMEGKGMCSFRTCA